MYVKPIANMLIALEVWVIATILLCVWLYPIVENDKYVGTEDPYWIRMADELDDNGGTITYHIDDDPALVTYSVPISSHVYAQSDALQIRHHSAPLSLTVIPYALITSITLNRNP